MIFRDTAAERGVCEYVLRVQGQGPDPVPENNRARLLVGVRGSRPVFCVSPSGTSGLPALLAKGGLKVQPRAASQCNWTLEELAGCSAVVLENTPANLLGHVGMTNLAAWVSQSGGGVMLTGGKDSYGPGGYYKSPLAPIMPVSMELRREHRKLSLAIVVALDRSGSMACTVPDGRAKIDLADLATAEVVNMLGPTDQFGCLAVNTIPHEIVPLSDVVDRGAMRSNILRIDAAGGGIYIYEALTAAARMILPARSGSKHIILFSDAADAEEPGDYKPLVAKCVKAGITISVVGLGTEKDCDAELLKDIARRGGGQCMFTNVAQELPRLFAQDTFLVARSAVSGRSGQRSPHGRADFDHPAAAGRFSQDRRIQSLLSSPERKLGRRLRGRVQGARAQLVAGGLGAGAVLCGRGRRKIHRPNRRLEKRRRLLHLARPLDGGKVPGARQRRRRHARTAKRGLPHRTAPQPGARRNSLHPPAGAYRPFGPARRDGGNEEGRDELVVGRHAVGGNPPDRQRDDPGDRWRRPAWGKPPWPQSACPTRRNICRRSRGKASPALEQLAKATGGCARLNLGDVWGDIPEKTPVDFLHSVSAACGRDRILPRGGAAAHGAPLYPLEADPRSSTQAGGTRPNHLCLQGQEQGERNCRPCQPRKLPCRCAAVACQGGDRQGSIEDALNRAQQRALKRTERD